MKKRLLNAFIMMLMSVPLLFFWAFVFTKMWEWYMVPAFGLEPLRLVYAIGISYLVTLINPIAPQFSEAVNDELYPWKVFMYKLIITLSVLFFGWLWKVILM